PQRRQRSARRRAIRRGGQRRPPEPRKTDMATRPVTRGSALLLAAIVGGCSPQGSVGRDRAVTLYRNSPLASEVRVHWATFDASDVSNYNLGNCQMAARILNANLRASAEAEAKQPTPNVGFWCEVGAYSEEGGVPANFDSEYPSDTTSPMRFSE